jgi:hypothetical protein
LRKWRIAAGTKVEPRADRVAILMSPDPKSLMWAAEARRLSSPLKEASTSRNSSCA